MSKVFLTTFFMIFGALYSLDIAINYLFDRSVNHDNLNALIALVVGVFNCLHEREVNK